MSPLRSCLSWLLLPLLVANVSCVSNRRPPLPLARFEYQRPEMGMAFRIVLYAPSQATADQAAEAAFGRIQQLNNVMSDYDPDSELSRLSRTSGHAVVVPVSDDLWFVLTQAQDLAERSGGAFDVTVGPYVNLWRRARRQQRLPEASRLAQAGRSVGYRHVRLDPQHQAVELCVPDMKLDLGGIAKGYAVNEALRTLNHFGVGRALVEGGGDVYVGDPPPGKKGWRIQLDSLDASNAPPARFLVLRNAAISTSGDLFQRLELDGKRYSHIVDPRTGMGLTNHCLVNVIAPNGITADSLTKVVSVLGPEQGLKFIEATPGAAARAVLAPRTNVEVFESSRFKRYYE